jgi:hypothetical protein
MIDLVEQAVAKLRAMPNPYERLAKADELDGALATSRTLVAEIKRDTINTLRTPTTGYGGIAWRIGLTKARVQQLANAPEKFAAATHAVRDETGTWYGEPDLLSGGYIDRTMANPFKPTDRFNPLWGQTLTIRCADLPDDGRLGLNAIYVETGEGMRPVRPTHLVLDALFGPHDVTTPQRREWEARRERRRRELEGDSAPPE